MEENYFFQSESETDNRGRPTGTYRIMRYSFSGGAALDRSRGVVWAEGLTLQEVSVRENQLNKEEEERRKKRDGA